VNCFSCKVIRICPFLFCSHITNLSLFSCTIGTTPGYGGSGNTHSSRSVFYETNTIKLMSLKRLPNNNWLKQQLSATVNINSSCNAYWSGSVNFYKSGGGCSNTGEIAAVTDHGKATDNL